MKGNTAMNCNEELLVHIHKISEMGKNTLHRLIPIIDDAKFKGVVESSHDEYSRIFMASDTLLKADGGDDSGVSPVSKTMGNVMIGLNSMTDSSVAHLAEMVMKGTDMGIEEIEQALPKLRGHASEEAKNLAECLHKFLLGNKEQLKLYL